MTIDDQVQRYHGPLRNLLDSRVHKHTLDDKKGSEIKNPLDFFLSFNFRRHANYKETQNKPHSTSCEFCALLMIRLFSVVSFVMGKKKYHKNKQVHVTCPFVSDVTDSIEQNSVYDGK